MRFAIPGGCSWGKNGGHHTGYKATSCRPQLHHKQHPHPYNHRPKSESLIRHKFTKNHVLRIKNVSERNYRRDIEIPLWILCLWRATEIRYKVTLIFTFGLLRLMRHLLSFGGRTAGEKVK